MAFAFVFPGQGSQAVGMLRAARDAFPTVDQTLAEASEALGYDMGALYDEGPAEKLALTEFTQPAILAASVALYRTWLAEGGAQPAMVAGHSLGEYSALVAAGTLSLTDAVRLVRRRGQAMQEAVPAGEGAMAAIIGLSDDVIIDICASVTETAGEFVGAVNFNAPGQVVIAGAATAVKRATEALKEEGAKRALPLPVSAPFHTPLMAPAAAVMAEELSDIRLASPAMPVLSNVEATGQTDAEVIRTLLVQQVASPVRWTECVQWMRHQAVSTFIECGPGKVLSGLIKRIDKSSTIHNLEQPDAMRDTLANLES
ncbi:MAG: ACP S-malonyltransferase [Halieaceae bacterium]|jgi:[acyl-carrier-protein] S-malonyltransferase|nr:ACP S-malonyltransferase [Halieaceae bacterium]